MKLPKLNSSVNPDVDVSDLAFKIKRRRFVVEVRAPCENMLQTLFDEPYLLICFVIACFTTLALVF